MRCSETVGESTSCQPPVSLIHDPSLYPGQGNCLLLTGVPPLHSHPLSGHPLKKPRLRAGAKEVTLFVVESGLNRDLYLFSDPFALVNLLYRFRQGLHRSRSGAVGHLLPLKFGKVAFRVGQHQ